jgi:hypothetical protein
MTIDERATATARAVGLRSKRWAGTREGVGGGRKDARRDSCLARRRRYELVDAKRRVENIAAITENGE